LHSRLQLKEAQPLNTLTNKVTVMLKSLLKNRKGTAEVIGSVMFIVILLFFFTNVYLWHDAATKDMNDLYAQKINSPITVSIMSDPYHLNVTNNGGVAARLSILWVTVNSPTAGSLDTFHGYFNLTQSNVVIPAGLSKEITWNSYDTLNGEGARYYPQTGDNVVLKVITTVGNSAACSYIN
jgi:hypothetical protein